MDVYTVTLMASITCWLYKTYVGKVSPFSGFSLGCLHMGDLSPLPPIWGGGQKHGDKSLMEGGNHEEGHRLMRRDIWGDLTLIDYIIN